MLRPLSALLASALVVPFAVARPSTTYETHHKRDGIPASWIRSRSLELDETVPLEIHLAQSNLDKGAEHLINIANPRSSSYGKHWSKQDILEFFKPHQSTIDTVEAWLTETGISSDRLTYSNSGSTLKLKASSAEAESLLQTKFHVYAHRDSDTNAISCDEYSLPAHVRRHVDYITPTIMLPTPKRQKRSSATGVSPRLRFVGDLPADNGTFANCSNNATPQCIKKLYQIPDFDGPAQPGNSLGIYESTDEPSGVVPSDLASFFAGYAPNIPNDTTPVDGTINGGLLLTDSYKNEGNEVMLDLDCAYPIVYPQTITSFNTDNSFNANRTDNPTAANTGIDTFLDAVDKSYCDSIGGDKAGVDCGKYNITNVVSFSYGTNEVNGPPEYVDRVCNEFMKLSLQGVTIVFSSGDGGTTEAGGAESCAGPPGPTGSGNVTLPEIFNTCPWVTSVGDTQIKQGADITQPGSEEVWNEILASSGGGFSNYFARPSWQNDTVNQWLATANLSVLYPYYQFSNTTNATQLGAGSGGGVFNGLGRAYPDVAALAMNITVFQGGNPGLGSGTSASTPIFAAMITRINEERLKAGKSTVGFINPVLYANADAFNDIVDGDADGCLGRGFSAMKGWDPTTGLGTPIYPKLLNVFMALQ